MPTSSPSRYYNTTDGADNVPASPSSGMKNRHRVVGNNTTATGSPCSTPPIKDKPVSPRHLPLLPGNNNGGMTISSSPSSSSSSSPIKRNSSIASSSSSSPTKRSTNNKDNAITDTQLLTPIRRTNTTRGRLPPLQELPTSPLRVKMNSTNAFGTPTGHKRRQAPKAKTSSMLLTGMVQWQQHGPEKALLVATTTATTTTTTKPRRPCRTYYLLCTVLVVSSLLVIQTLVVQNRFLKHGGGDGGEPEQQQRALYFLDVPSSARQQQQQRRTAAAAITTGDGSGSSTTTDATFASVTATIPMGETHSATEGATTTADAAAAAAAAADDDAHSQPPEASLLPYAIVHVLHASSSANGGDDRDDNNDDCYALELYTIVASTLIQRRAGSRAAQTFLYVTGATQLPAHHMDLLQAMNIQVMFVDVKLEKQEKDKKRNTTALNLHVFHRFMSDLAHYERILYMKPSLMARGSMDYLYHASKSGLLQENIVFADRQSPATADIFLLRPSRDISMLVHDNMFHPDSGWGHAFQRNERYELLNGRVGNRWDFVGADDTPGLLYHYARFDRGMVSIVLQDAIHSISVDVDDHETMFESLMSLNDAKLMALADFQSCWPDTVDHLPCRLPHSTFVRMDYTAMAQRPADLSFETAHKSPAHYWHHALDVVNADFSIDADRIRQLIKSRSASRFAYAFVVGGCDPDNDDDGSYKNFIYQILINAFVLKEAGSLADIVLFVQMAYGSVYETLPEDDIRYLDKMNVKIQYIEKYKEESFDSIIMDKFRVLQLPQYKRIIFCDSDVMLRESLDCLFDLSMRGVLRSNVVFATEQVPATGHLFMLSPMNGDWDHIMDISQRSGKDWNDVQAWGHSFADNDGYDLTSGRMGDKWDFPGANADQGLLYHWVKYEEQDGSLFVGESIQNWSEQRHESTLKETMNLNDVIPSSNLECWEDVMDGQPCRSPYNQYIHFSGTRKPWLQEPPNDLSVEASKTSALHFWFHTFSKVNDQLGIGLDIQHWKPSKLPPLGLSVFAPLETTMGAWNGTTYQEPGLVAAPYSHDLRMEHKFAYAYVIGGVLPENPSYRNYFNDIMISTYNQREEGSKADVLVFVQMAFKSQFDVLPEEDLRLLNAMSISVRYIPKAEDESFYRIMLDKFRVLGLTEYSRVIFMDGDVMAVGSLDYLFGLSIKGILKENVVFAGVTEPANGGFFLVTPKEGATDRIRTIISEKEERGSKLPYPHWDNAIGWGHELEDGDYVQLLDKRNRLAGVDAWKFYGSFAVSRLRSILLRCFSPSPLQDQGLLYHWVKYVEKSVSIVFRDKVQNWSANAKGRIHLEETLSLDIFDGLSVKRPCFKGVLKLKPCRAPHSDFVHFTGTKKPWLKGPPEDYQTAFDASAAHYWFYILSMLNTKLEIGLDFENWKTGQRPELGLFPLKADAAKTSYT